jgi:3-methyladenine DNA glycosylase AlkD
MSWKFVMKKDKLIISVTIMIALISFNYHIWINEIKAWIEKSMIWQYVNSDIDLFVSKRSESSSSSDYMMIEEDVEASRSAISKKELTFKQQKKYKANCFEYNMLNRHHERITQRLRTVQSAIRTSAKQYIFSNKFVSSSRKMIQMLAARYKLD